MKYVWFFVISCFVSFFTTAQEQEDILFTINGEAVFENEFIRVYKKNLDLIEDETQKDIDAYLESFINFKLKILEAKNRNHHKRKAYLNELNNYKNILVKNYSTTTTVSEELIQEAYERLQTEINANHILVRLASNALPADTLSAYKRIVEIRNAALKEGFENVSTQVHDGKTIIAESLGYFSVLRMDHLFEKETYAVKIGEISKPVRTPFGYHIIKVKDRRTNRGNVTIAHILLEDRDNTGFSESSQQAIQKIYNHIKQGANFETMALQFSDDRSNAEKGGQLPILKSSELNGNKLEEVAFSLAEGEISKPFQSKYGWHIIKIIKKEPIGSYEKERIELKKSIKRDDRSKHSKISFFHDLKERYQFKDFGHIAKIMNTKTVSIKTLHEAIANKNLFKLEYEYFKGKDFISYLEEKQLKNSELSFEEYNDFIEHTIIKYHEKYLEKENEAYAAIVSEYRDGLLMFDIMKEEIWDKSRDDTLAIQSYFKKNSAHYTWNKKIKAMIFLISDKKKALRLKKILDKNASLSTINKKMKSEFKEEIIPTEQIIEINDSRLPHNYIAKLGVSDIFSVDGSYILVNTTEIIDESFKTTKEANNQLVSDYQKFLEEKWLMTLRSNNEININEKVFNKIKEKLLE